MRSCQTGSAGDSTTARSAGIKVDDKKDITVLLDDYPYFVLRGGVWIRFRDAY
jgi:hypothetical protein